MKMKNIQPNNSVLRDEIKQMERTIPRWNWWIELPGVVTGALAITLYIVLVSIQPSIYKLWSPWERLLEIFLPLNWLVQFIVALRAMRTGEYVMSHSLFFAKNPVVTPTLTEIILGKWWVAMYRIRGWIVALGIIQLAILAVLDVQYNFDQYQQAFYPKAISCALISTDEDYYSRLCSDQSVLDRVEYKVIIATPTGLSIAILMTLLNVSTCVAIGMATGSLKPLKGWKRIFYVIAWAVPLILFSFYPSYYFPDRGYVPWWHEVWFTVADGAASIVLRWLTFAHPEIISTVGSLKKIPFLSSLILIFLLIAGLAVVWVMLRRHRQTVKTQSDIILT